MKMEKCGLFVDVFVLFLLSPPFRLSFVSVVFDFNASLNDVAPVSPMLLPVVFLQNKECIADECLLCGLFCVDTTNQVE